MPDRNLYRFDTAATPAVTGEHGLLSLFRTLWRRKRLILATTAAVTALGAAVIPALEPKYEAEAKVMVDPRAAAPLGDDEGSAGSPVDSEAVQSQVHVLLSRDLAHEAVRQLRLTEDPTFNPLLEPPSLPTQVRDWAASLIGEQLPGLAALTASEPASLADAGPAAVEARAVERFLRALKVGLDARSRVITLRFTANSPQQAADVVNTYADLYLESQLESRLAAVEAIGGRLKERAEVARGELRDAEQAVEDFRKQARLVRGPDATPATQQMSEFSSQIVEARAAKIQAEAKLRAAERLVAAGRIDSAPDVQRSSAIQQLRTQEADAARRVADLSQRLGDRHPLLLNARAELSEIHTKIDAEAVRIVGGLKDEVAVAVARLTALEQALKGVKGEVEGQNVAEVQLRELEREAGTRRQTLEALLAKVQAAQEVESLGAIDAKLISRADPPLEPAFPKRGLLLAVAGIAGMSLGVFLALLWEALRRGFRSMDEVEHELGLPALALVPRSRKPVDRLIERPRSVFAESIRALAMALRPVVGSPSAQVLAVTSPLPNEGKTTIAAALGRVLAVDGRRVLLIDADLRNPSVHAMLRLRASTGLGDILAGTAIFEDAVIQDTRSELQVLPAGKSAANPMALLNSPAMQALMAELRQRFDVIILDTPPLLPVADARLLAGLADQAILTLQWAKTTRSTAKLAARYLSQAGTMIGGVVISQVDPREHASYGYGDSAAYSGAAMKYYVG